MRDWLLNLLRGVNREHFDALNTLHNELASRYLELRLEKEARITELSEEIIRLRDENRELQAVIIELAKEKQVSQPLEPTKLQTPAHSVRSSWPRMKRNLEEKDVLEKIKIERGYVRTVNGDWVIPGKN